MSQDENSGTFGLGPRVQIGIAIGLVAVLAVLLISKYGSASSDPAGEGSEATLSAEQQLQTSEKVAAEMLRSEVQPHPLPQPPRVLFITRDPFAPTDKLRQALGNQAGPVGLPVGSETTPAQIAQATLLQASTMNLKGIIGEGADRVAFVNDKVVRQGAVIEEFTVLEIHDREVVLEKDGKRVVLTLAEPGGKANAPRLVAPPDPD